MFCMKDQISKKNFTQSLISHMRLTVLPLKNESKHVEIQEFFRSTVFFTCFRRNSFKASTSWFELTKIDVIQALTLSTLTGPKHVTEAAPAPSQITQKLPKFYFRFKVSTLTNYIFCAFCSFFCGVHNFLIHFLEMWQQCSGWFSIIFNSCRVCKHVTRSHSFFNSRYKLIFSEKEMRELTALANQTYVNILGPQTIGVFQMILDLIYL